MEQNSVLRDKEQMRAALTWDDDGGPPGDYVFKYEEKLPNATIENEKQENPDTEES